MRYELAKQLKEAGWETKNVSNVKEDGSSPTLSELIEACGEGFGGLKLHLEEWDAWSKDRETLAVQHKTPEEAVAKLWLKLHEKN
uniref:Uncharacterized protein n=1 Tax=viral metagenome TaxID=1070528 RepID=A0A6M3Y500_9ZZZZ